MTLHALNKVYAYAAFLALLHMIGLLGAGAYLLGTGTVNGDKIQRLAAAWRGDGLVNEATAVASAAAEPAAEAAEGAAPLDFATLKTNLDILRLEAERIKTELDQRLALNNSILLRVTTSREAFQDERKQAAEDEAEAGRLRQEDGFRKQIAIYGGLKPKVAVQHLMGMADPTEGARILMELDARKARKIVEAAKTGEQLARMKVILERVRDVAPDRASQLVDGS